jgi:hypothetical protein
MFSKLWELMMADLKSEFKEFAEFFDFHYVKGDFESAKWANCYREFGMPATNYSMDGF